MGVEISNASIFFLLPIPNHTPSAGSLKCRDPREKSITHCSHFPSKTSLRALHLQDGEGGALLVVLCWLPVVPVCSSSPAPLPRSRVPSTGGFGQAAWAKLCSPGAAELSRLKAEGWGPAARKHAIKVPESSVFAAFGRTVRPPWCGTRCPEQQGCAQVTELDPQPWQVTGEEQSGPGPPLAAHSSSLTHRHHRSPALRFSEHRPVYICS